MSSYTTESIRSIALVGHGGAGKTTLAEALLFKTGVIKVKGAVEKGSTVCDYDPQEKAAGHSLQSALVNFAYEGVHIHLIDTPGYPDFSGQAMAALAGVDTALIVINAQTGIELATTRMMNAARARGLARMIVINKIDVTVLTFPISWRPYKRSLASIVWCLIYPHMTGTTWSTCSPNPVAIAILIP